MADERLTRMAALLVDYSVNVQDGDRIAVMGEPAAAPLILPVYERILERGGHPDLSLGLPGIEESFFRLASDEQMQHISPIRRMILEEYDGLISIRSETNTRELTAVDPARQAMRQKVMAPLLKRYMERGATGELRWNGTLYPTPAYALEANMSLRDFEDFVYAACYCDREDPVSAWRTVHAEQQRAIDWLKGRSEVRITGPTADLALSVKDRIFINSDGRHNMPSGEIFTGPVETSVNGWVRFNYPAVSGGREVEGVELHFEDGRVVKASAAKNEPYLHRMLESDAGARYLGEFAIGTNFGIQRFTKNILFDEKIGGSFHLALGAGYPDTGSQNTSAIHWDMICDMRSGGEIRVDGDLFLKDGRFAFG